jgi:hypothetical protein
MIPNNDSNLTQSDIDKLVRFINFITENATFPNLSSKQVLDFGNLTVTMMNLKQKLDQQLINTENS